MESKSKETSSVRGERIRVFATLKSANKKESLNPKQVFKVLLTFVFFLESSKSGNVYPDRRSEVLFGSKDI